MDGKYHPRNWENEAACIGIDTELFFPPRVRGLYEQMADEAKSYCWGSKEIRRRECPVRESCLEWAIQSDESYGIYGGMSHRERNALLRRRHKAAQKDGPPCHPTCVICIEGEEQRADEDPA